MVDRPRYAPCPKHGNVPLGFTINAIHNPDCTTGDICAECYVEWVKANIPPLLPLTAALTGDPS